MLYALVFAHLLSALLSLIVLADLQSASLGLFSATHRPLFAQGLVFPLRLADVTLSCYGFCAFVSRRLGERDSTHCSPTNAWAGSVWCIDHLVVAFVVGTTPCVVQHKCKSQDVNVCACAFMTCFSRRRVLFFV